MNFKQILNEEIERLDKANMEQELKKEIVFRKKCEALEPMVKELNDGMKQLSMDIKFVLHTNEEHYPCPSIHIDRSNKFRGILYSEFGEIFKSDYDGSKKLNQEVWRMGSCNSHLNRAETDEDLVKFVVKKIANKCFKRKNLRGA